MNDVEVLQVQSELDWMVDLYRQRAPKRVLEIGVHEGGTLREWLQNAHVGTTVVAVDLLHKNAREYARWCEPGVTLVTITGSSQSAGVKSAIVDLGEYDWIFVDGDHSLKGVRSDAFTCERLLARNGIMLLHDIVDGDGEVYPPGKVLCDMEERYVVERVVHEGSGSPHGIGAVYR